MKQPITQQELRRATALTKELQAPIGSKVDATFLIETVQDFPQLFGQRYQNKFGR